MPDVVKFAIDCERFGAQGITVHPRPDERHITRADVRALRPVVTTEFNIEGYPAPEFMDLVIEVRPDQVTLVPDSPSAVTSNADGTSSPTRLSCEGYVPDYAKPEYAHQYSLTPTLTR